MSSAMIDRLWKCDQLLVTFIFIVSAWMMIWDTIATVADVAYYSTKFYKNSPQFYPSTIFILADLLCKAANLPVLFLPNALGLQSFMLHAILLYYINFVITKVQNWIAHNRWPYINTSQWVSVCPYVSQSQCTRDNTYMKTFCIC